MLLREVDPFVRCAVRFRYARPYSVRCPADARVLYVTEGAGKLFLEGAEHPLRAGTLALIGPGVVYRMELEHPLELIALNFDYTWQRQELEETLEALPPEAAEQMERVCVEDCAALSTPLVLQEVFGVKDALENIVAVFQARKCFFREEMACRLKELLIRLARTAMLTNADPEELTDRLIRYLQEHYSEDITVEEIAAHFHYHASHINRLMRQATGTTIRNYLIRCRIDTAKALLVSTELSVSRIAARTGFQSAGYFSNAFRKDTGQSPSQYRASRQNV